MSDVISEMQGLGYSEYEARAYVTLLERGPLTGYQLARATSIPRPNIYPVLATVTDGDYIVSLPPSPKLTKDSGTINVTG